MCGEMCSNNVCDLNCVCSFRMSFLFVFVCLYISNCSRVSSFRPFVCTCSKMCIRDRRNHFRNGASWVRIRVKVDCFHKVRDHCGYLTHQLQTEGCLNHTTPIPYTTTQTEDARFRKRAR